MTAWKDEAMSQLDRGGEPLLRCAQEVREAFERVKLAAHSGDSEAWSACRIAAQPNSGPRWLTWRRSPSNGANDAAATSTINPRSSLSLNCCRAGPAPGGGGAGTTPMNRSHCWEAPALTAHLGRWDGFGRPASLSGAKRVRRWVAQMLSRRPWVAARRGVHFPGDKSQAELVLSVTVTMLRYAGRRAVIMER